MTVLFSFFVGLLEIIFTPSLMWLFYELFLVLLTHASVAAQDLALLFSGGIVLGLFTASS